MQVKRYEAANIKDILVKIRRELGPDAIVLSSRQLPGEKKLMEVLAANDSGFEKKDASGGTPLLMETELVRETEKDDYFSLRDEITEIKLLLRKMGGGGTEAALAGLKEAVEAVIDLSGSRIHEKDGGDVLARIYSSLVCRGLSKKSALKLLADAGIAGSLLKTMGFEEGFKTVEAAMKKVFVKNGKENRRVKIFLGPTGVGKTTTLAKLAARYALQQKKSVGLITTDTYRIGAVEQLKTYAQIIDLPLEVADSREAFRRSLERFQNRDCILVDTPGRGADTADYLLRLKEMVAGEEELEASLLLTPTASRENMMDVVAGFGAFGCDRIIFTKLDECSRFGALYDVMEKIGKPVSYLTYGQKVPQDIEKATPDKLAELILRPYGYGVR